MQGRSIFQFPDDGNLLGRGTNLQNKQGKTQYSGHLQKKRNASPSFFWKQQQKQEQQKDI